MQNTHPVRYAREDKWKWNQNNSDIHVQATVSSVAQL